MTDIILDDYKFTCIEKIISNDRCFVWLKSQKTDSTDVLDFIVYKSNSQGMWRYYTCITYYGCPYKWEDYTTTTVIDFRLQTFLNKNLESIKLSEYTSVSKYEFKSTVFDYLSDFMLNEHVVKIPEFEVIFMQFGNPVSDEINMAALMEKEKFTIDSYKYNKTELTDSVREDVRIYKEKYEEFKKLFTGDELNNNEYLLYELLKKISIFISNNFKTLGTPVKEEEFDKKIFKFENAKLKQGVIITSHRGRIIKSNTTNTNEILYPYSENVIIYSIILLHNATNTKYKLYYMKYKIKDDDYTYYMPLLITPETTRISKYGMPYKYVRTGIYCNKPWDYLSQCFFKKRDKTAAQICRKTDNYAFIGKNYKTIWPFNLPIITGLTKEVVSSNKNDNISNLGKKEAEERAKKEAEELAKKEAEELAKKEEEELAKKEAEERAKKEAEERAKKEAEELAKKEAEELAKKEVEEQAKKEAEERAKKEAEERAKKEAEERAKKEAEELAKKEAEERAKKKQTYKIYNNSNKDNIIFVRY